MHQAIKATACLAVASRGYFTGRGETARVSKEDGQGSCSVDFTRPCKSHMSNVFFECIFTWESCGLLWCFPATRAVDSKWQEARWL